MERFSGHEARYEKRRPSSGRPQARRSCRFELCGVLWYGEPRGGRTLEPANINRSVYLPFRLRA